MSLSRLVKIVKSGKLFLTFLILSFILILPAQGNAQEYNLTFGLVNADTDVPEEAGTISVSIYDAVGEEWGDWQVVAVEDPLTLDEDTEVAVKAESDPGWRFDKWVVDPDVYLEDDGVITLVMTEDFHVDALFKETHTLTVRTRDMFDQHAEGSSYISIDGVSYSLPSGGRVMTFDKYDVYPAVTEVELIADAREGWEFFKWKIRREEGVNYESSAATIPVDMDDEIIATAHFKKIQTLTLSHDGLAGNIDIISVDPPDAEIDAATYYKTTVLNGDITAVTLEATANPGWRFDKWEVEPEDLGVVNNNEVTVTMADDVEVIAHFIQQFDLEIVKVGEGTVAPVVGTHTYDSGEQVTLIADDDDANFIFDHWLIEKAGDEDIISVKTINVTMSDDVTATAHFLERFSFTYNVSPQEAEGDVNIVVSPDPHEVSDQNGLIDYYKDGTVVTIEAIDVPGWEFDKWEVDGADVTDNPAEIAMTENVNVTAEFIQTYDLTVAGIGQMGTLEIVRSTFFQDLTLEHTVPEVGATYYNRILSEGSANGDYKRTGITYDVGVDYAFSHWKVIEDGANVDIDAHDSYEIHQNGYLLISDNEDPLSGHDFTAKHVEVEAVVYKMYDLTRVEEGNGTISPTLVDGFVSGDRYSEGSKVVIEAVAENSWRFDRWEVNPENLGVVDGNEVTVTMNADIEVTAYFVEQYNLEVTKVGEGTTTPEPGIHPYDVGDQVLLTANAAEGWAFVHWMIDGVIEEDSQFILTMDSPKNAEAVFGRKRYLTTNYNDQEGSVVVSPLPEGEEPDEYYIDGTEVTLEATPIGDFIFHYWEVVTPLTTYTMDNPIETITMATNKIVTAHFIQGYELTIEVVGEGTTDPIPGVYIYETGELVTIQAIPDDGWMFDRWEVDSEIWDDIDGAISVVMDAHKTATAFFVRAYDLNVLAPEGQGTTDPDQGSREYAAGSLVPVKAIPHIDEVAGEYWRFDKWQIKSVDFSFTYNSYDPVTYVSMFGEMSAKPYFAEQHLLTVNEPVANEGTISADGIELTYDNQIFDKLYDTGYEVELTVEANAGWRFLDWSVVGVEPGDWNVVDGILTVTMTDNAEVTANFQKTYDLTLYVDPEGAGEIEDNESVTMNLYPEIHTFDEGHDLILHALPADDTQWIFDYWMVNGVQENDLALTISMDEDIEITAHFAKLVQLITAVDPVLNNGNHEINVLSPLPAHYEDNGDIYYREGTTVELEALAVDQYWKFTQFIVARDDRTPITIEAEDVIFFSVDMINADVVTVTAEFFKWVTFAEHVNGDGSIENLSFNADPQEIEGVDHYLQGTRVTATAVADNDWRFMQWTIDENGDLYDLYEANLDITLKENTEVEAIFYEEFDLHVMQDGDGDGIVELNEVEIELPYNAAHVDQVKLEAFTADNSRFVKWVINGEDVWDEVVTLDMNIDITAVAHFRPEGDFILTVVEEPEAGGTVSVDPDRYDFIEDIQVTLTAHPDYEEGFVFDRWEVRYEDEGAILRTVEDELDITVTMYEDKHVTAYFTDDTRTVTIAIDAYPEGWAPADLNDVGAILINSEITEHDQVLTFKAGRTIDVASQTYDGWSFDSWKVVRTDSQTEYYDVEGLIVEENKTITAYFIKMHEFSAVVIPEDAGTIDFTVEPEADEYVHDTEVTMLAEAEAGWRFDNWIINGQPYSNSGVTINVTEPIDAEAHFVKTFDLTINEPTHGDIVVEGVTLLPEDYDNGIWTDTYDIDTYVEINMAGLDPDQYVYDHWYIEWEIDGDPKSERVYTQLYNVKMTADKKVTVDVRELFELTTVVDPIEDPAAGYITVVPEQDKYRDGTEVTLTASANEGWRFDKWIIDGDQKDDIETTYTIGGNVTATAHFVDESDLTLAIEPVGSGEIHDNDGLMNPEQTHRYNVGEEVELTAIPDQGWRFDKWEVDGEPVEDVEGVITIIMDTDKTATAYFIEQFELTVHDPAYATIYVNGTEVDGLYVEKYDIDTVVELTVEVDEPTKWVFAWWLVDAATETDYPLHVTMDDNKVVSAEFDRLRKLTIIDPEEAGTIEIVSPEDIPYYVGNDYYFIDGTDVTLIAEANEEEFWRFDKWVFDVTREDESVYEEKQTLAEVTFTMDENKDIVYGEAHFLKLYQLTTIIEPEGAGTIEVTPDTPDYIDGDHHYYFEGTNITLNADFNSGWRFDYWIADGDLDPEDPSLVYITMNDDTEVTAVFIEERQLTVNVEGMGDVQLTPDAINQNGEVYYYLDGDVVTLEATPAEDWLFVIWEYADGQEIDPIEDHPYTIELTMDDDKEVVAVFRELEEFDLITAVAEGSEGWGTTDPVPGTHTYQEFSEKTITAIPEADYRFYKWVIDGEDVYEAETNITITHDITATAYFREPFDYELFIAVYPEGAGNILDADHEILDLHVAYPYEEHAIAELNAEATEAWLFSHWDVYGDVYYEVNDTNIQITMTDDVTVTAHYIKLHQLTMTVYPDMEAGEMEIASIDPDPIDDNDVVYYKDGTEVEIAARAKSGWSLIHWYVDDEMIETEGSFITVTMLDDTEVTAVFERERNLMMAVAEEGSGTTQPAVDEEPHIYLHGEEIEIEAFAADRWIFSHWNIVRATGVSYTDNSRVMTLTMNQDKTATAVFLPLYQVTTRVIPEDADTEEYEIIEILTDPTQDNLFVVGTEVELVMTEAPEGWRFLEWSVAGVEAGDWHVVDGVLTVTMTNDAEVTAHFQKTYELTVAQVGEGDFTVDPHNGYPYVYDEGTQVTVAASDAEGWIFNHWKIEREGIAGEEIVEVRQINLTMDQNKHVTAVFLELYQLTTNIEGEGDIHIHTDYTTGEYYKDGTEVHLEATADHGWVFDHWKIDDVVEYDTDITVVMDADKEVTAVFVEKRYLDLVYNEDEGPVTVDPLPEEENGDLFYRDGTQVELVASPNEGWLFVHWLVTYGDDDPVVYFDKEIMVTMDMDIRAKAVYRDEVDLTIEVADGEGHIDYSPAPVEIDNGILTYKVGDEIQLTAVPEDNQGMWRFDRWEVDGYPVEDVDGVITVTMDDDKHAAVYFVEQFHLTLDVDPAGEGIIVSDGQEMDLDPETYIYDYDDHVVLEALSTGDYGFSHWEVYPEDAIYEVDDNNITVTMTKDIEITAVFDQFNQLKVSISGEGQTQPEPGRHNYLVGSDVQIEAIDIDGWLFDRWIIIVGDDDPYEVNEAVTTVNMSDDINAIALFLPQYNLTVAVEGEGTTIPTAGTYSYDVGTEVILEAIVENEDWYFDRWVINGEEIFDAETVITMESNIVATAHFLEYQYYTLTLDVEPEGQGWIEYYPEPEEDGTYLQDTEVHLEAIAEHGWRFDYWVIGEETIEDAEISVIMNEDITAVAHFVEQVMLTVQVEGEGSTNPEVGEHGYDVGQEVVLLAIDDVARWDFTHWEVVIGDNEPVIYEDYEAVFDMPNVEVIATAHFNIFTYYITFDNVGDVRGFRLDGRVATTGIQYSRDEGEEIEIQVNPADRRMFTHWEIFYGDDDPIIIEENPYTLDVTDDIHAVAHVTRAWGLVMAYEGQGTITPEAGNYYPLPEGTEFDLEAEPAEDWVFDRWEIRHGDAAPAIIEEPETTIELTNNVYATAYFLPLHDLTIAIDGQGTTDPEPGVYTLYGEVEISASAILGWQFDRWVINGEEVYDATTTVNMTSDINATAYFVELHQLTISVEGEGTTDPQPGEHQIPVGTEVDLDAIADDGWTFDRWVVVVGLQMPVVYEDPEITIPITNNTVATAHFIPLIDMNISTVGQGTTDPAPGYHQIGQGRDVQLEAIANEGWIIERWVIFSGEEEPVEIYNQAIIDVTIEEETNIIAFFVHKYELTIAVEGQGTSVPEVGVYPYPSGAQVELDAIAADGWTFTHWEMIEDDEVTIVHRPDHTIRMYDDIHATANFVPLYDLTIEVEGEGTTDPEPGIHAYADGSEVLIESIPDDGWIFDHWEIVIGEDVIIVDEPNVTVEITEPIFVRGHFIEEFELIISVSGQGTTDPEPGNYYHGDGSEITLEATPAEGWAFQRWLIIIGEEEERITETIVDIEMTDDVTAIAYFRAKERLTIAVEGEGTTDPEAGEHLYPWGTEVELDAEPSDGWAFGYWEIVVGDDVTIADSTNATVTMNRAVTATAHFLELYDLTIAVEGQGTTNPNPGVHQYPNGSEVELEARDVVEGWIFDHWQVVEGHLQPQIFEEPVITITVDANKTATAHFIQWPDPNPTVATNPIPEDGATDVSAEIEELGWSYIEDEDHSNPVGFRVYFGLSPEFEEDDPFHWVPYAEDVEDYVTTKAIPEDLMLEGETTYYWKVVPTTVDPDGFVIASDAGRVTRNRHALDREDGPSNRGDAVDVPVWSFTTGVHISIEEDHTLTPLANELYGNYPNPFNPETTISFAVSEPGMVTLDIFNSRGQRVVTLLNDHLDAGEHKIRWNGRDQNNNEVGSGIYLYRMRTGNFVSTDKMIMIK